MLFVNWKSHPATKWAVSSRIALHRSTRSFVRGKVYLAMNNGREAGAEFQEYVDHPGVVQNYPLGALARLELGRAYAMQGDTAKTKAAYQDFLTLWRDADPDIPILKQAKGGVMPSS
jgi:hypothetical protein